LARGDTLGIRQAGLASDDEDLQDALRLAFASANRSGGYGCHGHQEAAAQEGYPHVRDQ
jgi:hypothetical protein